MTGSTVRRRPRWGELFILKLLPTTFPAHVSSMRSLTGRSTILGRPGREYWLVDTGEGEIGINGAIMPRAYKTQPVVHWISVDNLDAMIDKVKASGGEIVGERQTVPGIGDTIYAHDTEGNIFGMIQPLPRSVLAP